MITPGRGSISILAFISLTGLVGGCGGSKEDSGAEAEEIVQSLKSLKPGEILIQGKRKEKFSGPYTLRRGGYVLQFQRVGASGSLTVALESQRGSKQPPYKILLADSSQTGGRREITLSGRFYVHVVSTADGYVLRFAPKGGGR